MRKFLFIPLISLFILAGCSKDDNPVTPPVDNTPSAYAASWKDSVQSASGLEYAIVTFNGSGTNASLAGQGYLLFRKTGSSTVTVTRTLNPVGSVRNDSLFIVFSSASENEWEFKGKLNSTTGRVNGELQLKFKSYPLIADTTYKFNMSLKKQ
ncbi:MAG: hypothetical protein J0L60_04030 [Ignavibacteria bacterium]|mgnify:FL=1|nr:hypothetical protein [Ignavibacteria bacterium]MCA0386995.1 hypothetical protein [Bacteroidota bacterium]